MSQKLHALLKTALVLADQFQSTLDTTPPVREQDVTTTSSSSSSGTTQQSTPDPLNLLSNSAKSLRAQVTKLSLLAITAPFTPSALSTCLASVNDSVMPSMVTATLLITPDEYTKAFATEARTLVKTGLREFAVLVRELVNVAQKLETNTSTNNNKNKNNGGGEREELAKDEKDVITSQTGRVWDLCDAITTLVSQGVVGLMVKRVQEWHDLVKDAINELEEWDPEDEDEGGFEELVDSDDDDEVKADDKEEEDKDDDDKNHASTATDTDEIAALHTHKKSLIRALKPIAQMYTAISTYRLKRGAPLTASDNKYQPQQIAKLECLVSKLQTIPDHVDEAAGSLYEHNMEDCFKYLRLAKSTAETAIDLVVIPWNSPTDSPEDKFSVWSRTWRKVMDDVTKDLR